VLAFDKSGNLFFEERNTGTIFKIAPEGTRTTFATSETGAAINGDLAADAAGNLYVCVNFNTIFKFAPDGTRSTFATEVGSYWPTALAVDRTGNLFVGAGDSILKFTPDGTRSSFATGIEAYGLAFDQSGNLFASDSHGENGHLTSAIVKFTPDGNKSKFAAGVRAYGLAFDKADNLFAASGNGVLKFAPDGTKNTFAARVDVESLAFDAAGNLFASDENNRIFKLASDGTKTAFLPGGREPAAVEGEPAADSPTGLPDKYAKDYLVASRTLSPDKKFAVIYPTRDNEEFPQGRNYVVSLKPFVIVGKLDTKSPYFKNESHGGLSADWSDESSVALVTLDGKWGPRGIFLVELRDDKLSRITDILARTHDLLLPDYRKAKAERYNEYFDFIFESEDEAMCKLDGVKQVRIEGHATTDPKGLSRRKWSAQVKAVWDIPEAKFIEQKITRSTAKKSD
ncbi:MAG: hypothetical protein M3Y80_03495, partial [Verrucomicrobiota bacterium]|nr:hypothetical protein [Verrucomicrobiota bacterium]